jgi:tetratricopeptide (TPR) repeat protein
MPKPSILRMLTTAAIFLAIINNIACAQSVDDAMRLLMRRQLDSAELIAKKVVSREKSNPDAYLVLGRVQKEKGNYAEAISNLETALSFPGAKAYTKAWALCELSPSYFATGNPEKSRKSLRDCQALNATQKVMAVAQATSLRLGFDPFFDAWTTKETEHFIFHFQDTTAVAGKVAQFMRRKDAAFDTISNLLRAKLPKKIDYFVWADEAQGERMLKARMAFTESPLCLTHTSFGHTLGHEMTHSISYFAAKPAKTSRLISEGICVYLDFSKKTNASVLQGKADAIGSIADLWKQNKNAGEDIIYPLGGELVRRLIREFGREKFTALLADQSYENARKIYGDNLDILIGNLETDLRR